MRDSFGYESNVFLIRQFLVPDHMGVTEWLGFLQGWQLIKEDLSLLEFLAQEWRDERILLEMLAESLSVQVCWNPVYLEPEQLDSTSDMLRRHGFALLSTEAHKRLITGGTIWDPDLSRYLGDKAKDWQWVLVPPVRMRITYPDTDKGPASVSKENETFDWLCNLLNGLWITGANDIHLETKDETLIIRTHESSRMRTIGEWSDGRSSCVVRLLCRWAGLPDWDHLSFIEGTLVPPGGIRSSCLRFSLIPTVNGSSIVLRAPAPSLYARNLKDLGLPVRLIDTILDNIFHDSGLILCTGRTGSGKTTTLYGILHELASVNLKILTIEDPVEQVIPHAVQSSVDARNGWSFDAAIRAYLRQDPDVMMIGEIRDAVSAEAACRAALTGHCVLSTLHAVDAASAIERFAGYGISSSVLAESIRIIIHQRLEIMDASSQQPIARFEWEADPKKILEQNNPRSDAFHDKKSPEEDLRAC